MCSSDWMGQVSVHWSKDKARASLAWLTQTPKQAGVWCRASLEFSLRFSPVYRAHEESLSINGR